MQKIFLGFLGFAAIASAAITEVRVYPGGAQLTDARTIELKEGVNEIAWGSLLPGVDPESIKVTLPGGARLLDRTLEKNQSAEETNAARAKIEAQLKAAKARLEDAMDHQLVVQKSENYIDQIQAASTAPVRADAAYAFPAPAQWATLMAFISGERTRVLRERRAADDMVVQAQKEVARIVRQLNDLNNEPGQFTQQMILRIESAKAQRVPVAVAYFDPNASWRPTYQVWVDSSTQKVQLGYGAFVRQNSGENWNNIKLTLSTAQPQMSSLPPELTPWWVQERREAQRPMPLMAKAVMSREAVAINVAADTAAFAPTEVEQGLTFAEFKLPGTSNIPADNNEHRLMVAELPLKGELVYTVVPELDQQAYLQAKVVNSSELTLLAGETQIYADGNLVGRSEMKTVQPEESFEVNLGTDPAIKVERKQLARKVERTGLGEPNDRVSFSYRTEITNLKSTPVHVVVWERVPLSQHEKIKVDLIEPRKLAKDIDKEGKLKRDLILKPGQKETIDLSYRIEYPRNMQVEGL